MHSGKAANFTRVAIAGADDIHQPLINGVERVHTESGVAVVMVGTRHCEQDFAPRHDFPIHAQFGHDPRKLFSRRGHERGSHFVVSVLQTTVQLQLCVGIVMVVVFTKPRHEGQVFVIWSIKCPREEEINKPILLEGVAEVVQVPGSKRHRLYRRRFDDALEHHPVPEVLQDPRADEFCTVQGPVALTDKKHSNGLSIFNVGGHDAHHIDIVLYAGHVSPLSFTVTVIQLLFHIGKIKEGADASVAAAANYERAVGRVDQQKLVEVGHGLRVLAGWGRRGTGPGILFWARLGASLQFERRTQLKDGVNSSQVNATSLGVLDHIIDGGLGGELQDWGAAARLLGSYGRMAEEEEEGDPAFHLWREQNDIVFLLLRYKHLMFIMYRALTISITSAKSSCWNKFTRRETQSAVMCM